jgi:platelet-activating factor acetylhydrolase
MRLHLNILILYLHSFLALGDLGSYSGQYGVGTIDIELPVQSPTNITDTTLKNGTYAFRLDTVYFSLYYPIAPGTTSSKPQHPWLTPPKNLIAEGLSQAIGGDVPASLIQVGFDIFAANLNIPAQVDVPLISGTNQLPLMTFSHGDPTMSQWYSQFYGELASRGIVIAAITHRDGSSPATMVLFKNGTSYDIIAFTEAQVL